MFFFVVSANKLLKNSADFGDLRRHSARRNAIKHSFEDPPLFCPGKPIHYSSVSGRSVAGGAVVANR